MKAGPAVYWFLGVCVILAILLLLNAIALPMTGLIFALALIGFGVLSRGFRKSG